MGAPAQLFFLLTRMLKLLFSKGFASLTEQPNRFGSRVAPPLPLLPVPKRPCDDFLCREAEKRPIWARQVHVIGRVSVAR